MALIPLQQADPIRYKAWIENSQQPGATLQETQAAAGAAGASAARTTAEIPQVQATSKQLDIRNQAGQFFNSKTGHGKDGFTNPKDYNDFLNQYTQAGGNPDDFHRDFANKVNPNNIWYDTPDNISTRGNLPLLTTALKSYQNLPQDQVGPRSVEVAKYMEKIPGIGGALAQNYRANAIAHDASLNSQAGNIKNIISQQSQSGGYPLRNLTELGNMVNILPTSDMDTKTAEAKTTQLDNLLQAKFGLKGTQDLYKLFPGGGQ